MKLVWGRVSFVLLLILSLMSTGLAQTAKAAAFDGLTQLTNFSNPIGAVSTDGKTVVWVEYPTGDPRNGDIYGYSLADKKTFPIAVGNVQHEGVVIDNNVVVWSQSPLNQFSGDEIYAKNMTTGQEFKVGDGRFPNISGKWVIWYKGGTLMARDITLMSAPVTLANSGYAGNAAISGNRVVWGQESGDPVHGTQWKLFTQKIGDTNPPTVIDQGGGYGLFGWDVKGDTIVYSDNFNITVASLANPAGSIDKFSLNLRNAELPTTDGRYLFWTNTAGDGNHDITGYDLKTNVYLKGLTNGIQNDQFYSNGGEQLRNGVVIWDYDGYYKTTHSITSGLYAAPVSAFLPTASQPAFTSNSSRYYFSQTQHTLSFGFKYFWEHSGGLPVFGYPLTEEFQEPNFDTGKTYTVQYFERERFEYHPEFKGTAYETELGRLGVTDAQQRGLADTTPFQSVTDQHKSDCVFFPTGHTACGKFLTYWQSHGLEFGDAGISYRESLALFGYPISQPFTNPQSGLTVQYFERARFEYHPQFAGTSNEIELGLLGQQAVTNKGW